MKHGWDVKVIWTALNALPALRALGGPFDRAGMTISDYFVSGHLFGEYFEKGHRRNRNVLRARQTVPASPTKLSPELMFVGGYLLAVFRP